MEAFLLQPMQAFLRYLDLHGDQPAHVYLAGLGLAATGVYGQVVRSAPLVAYRTLLPDYLGCGFSDCPKDFSYSIHDHAAAIAQLLDALHITPCVLVGHSMGGSVAITLAGQRPDLVKCLILAEANLDPGGGAFSRGIASATEADFIRERYGQLIQAVTSQGQAGDLAAAVAAGIWQIADPSALYRSAVSLVQGTQPSWRELLYQLPMPCGFIFGENSLPDTDTAILPTHGIRIAVVPRAGHAMMLENPSGFAEAVAVLAQP